MLTLYPAGAEPTHAIWFDLMNPTEAERAIVEAATGLSVPTLAQISEIESSSRLNAVGDALYLSTPAIARGAADVPEVSPIGLVLSPRHLVSIRFTELTAFHTAGQRFPPRTCSAEAFVSLFEAIVDRLADVLEQVGLRLDNLSQDVFQSESHARTRHRAADAALRDILRMVGRIGDHVSKLREVLLGVGRIVPYVSEMAHDWLPEELAPRLKTLRRDIDSLRDYDGHLDSKVQFLLDATLGFINIQQNNIFKILTVVSVVGIPPTLVAGIYGMNFKNMPELSWSWGYEYGWAVIILSALIPLAWFLWRRWI
ncbi:MAG TPA: magnesium transporter CorA family protein [Stellaceae bacterium]|nr:magnesium transporter CorA family protein [Stellaceae bacterium]